MSNSQQIKQVMKQENKNKPKVVNVDDTKSTRPKQNKRVEQKKKTRRDTNPFTYRKPHPPKTTKQHTRELVKESFDIESRYNRLIHPKNTKDYPLIKKGLGEFRIEEVKMSNQKGRAQMSFIRLFGIRLDQFPGERDTVSIIIDVEISSPEQLEEVSGPGEDQFGMENKLVIQQTSHMGFIRKTYGPFTEEIPVGLSTDDIYRFTLFTLLKRHFTYLSAEFITGIGSRIIKLTKKDFKDQKMGELKLESYLLNNQRTIKSHGVK